jgi:hypothetical protein
MIPCIADILAGLLNGSYTLAQCEGWINKHIELGSENADLRDHFAGLAMQGLVSTEIDGVYDGSTKDQLTAARAAYLIADAMLAARATD